MPRYDHTLCHPQRHRSHSATTHEALQSCVQLCACRRSPLSGMCACPLAVRPTTDACAVVPIAAFAAGAEICGNSTIGK